MGDNSIYKFYVGDSDVGDNVGGANAISFYDRDNSKMLVTELLWWARFRFTNSHACHQQKLSPT